MALTRLSVAPPSAPRRGGIGRRISEACAAAPTAFSFVLQLLSISLLSGALLSCDPFETAEERCVSYRDDDSPAVPPRLLSGRWSLNATGCACGRPLRLQTRSFTVAQEDTRLFLASTPSLEWFAGEVRDEALSFSITYRGEDERAPDERGEERPAGYEGSSYQLDFVATRFNDLFFEGFFSGTTPGCLEAGAPLGRFTIDLLVVGLGAEEE